MAQRDKNKKKKRKHLNLPAAGSSPGLIFIDDNALEPIITIHSFSADEYQVNDVESIAGLKHLMKVEGMTYWVNIRGLKSAEVFEVLYEDFNINKLVLEDITRTYQRPKIEEYDDYVFAISRMLFLSEENGLENEQMSFLLLSNVLFTFQESYEDIATPVRKRLKVGRGNIRTAGTSYLMYALMDVLIDHYFVILNAWGEDLDRVEDELLDKPDRSLMFAIQEIKRNLINIRRVAWPERDKLNDIIRSDSPLIAESTKPFVKDAYDHCIQTIDIIESLKEISASNLDMYLSIISNRMNEIMKVLTIISSIFIPLTFVAGIYGMNFVKQDPVTGKLLPDNMPELYIPHGYQYTLIAMGVIAIGQIIYFWRRGWFK